MQCKQHSNLVSSMGLRNNHALASKASQRILWNVSLGNLRILRLHEIRNLMLGGLICLNKKGTSLRSFKMMMNIKIFGIQSCYVLIICNQEHSPLVIRLVWGLDHVLNNLWIRWPFDGQNAWLMPLRWVWVKIVLIPGRHTRIMEQSQSCCKMTCLVCKSWTKESGSQCSQFPELLWSILVTCSRYLDDKMFHHIDSKSLLSPDILTFQRIRATCLERYYMSEVDNFVLGTWTCVSGAKVELLFVS